VRDGPVARIRRAEGPNVNNPIERKRHRCGRLDSVISEIHQD